MISRQFPSDRTLAGANAPLAGRAVGDALQKRLDAEFGLDDAPVPTTPNPPTKQRTLAETRALRLQQHQPVVRLPLGSPDALRAPCEMKSPYVHLADAYRLESPQHERGRPFAGSMNAARPGRTSGADEQQSVMRSAASTYASPGSSSTMNVLPVAMLLNRLEGHATVSVPHKGFGTVHAESTTDDGTKHTSAGASSSAGGAVVVGGASPGRGVEAGVQVAGVAGEQQSRWRRFPLGILRNRGAVPGAADATAAGQQAVGRRLGLDGRTGTGTEAGAEAGAAKRRRVGFAEIWQERLVPMEPRRNEDIALDIGRIQGYKRKARAAHLKEGRGAVILGGVAPGAIGADGAAGGDSEADPEDAADAALSKCARSSSPPPVQRGVHGGAAGGAALVNGCDGASLGAASAEGKKRRRSEFDELGWAPWDIEVASGTDAVGEQRARVAVQRYKVGCVMVPGTVSSETDDAPLVEDSEQVRRASARSAEQGRSADAARKDRAGKGATPAAKDAPGASGGAQKGKGGAAAEYGRRDETCPVSTGGGTRRVQSVREGGAAAEPAGLQSTDRGKGQGKRAAAPGAPGAESAGGKRGGGSGKKLAVYSVLDFTDQCVEYFEGAEVMVWQLHEAFMAAAKRAPPRKAAPKPERASWEYTRVDPAHPDAVVAFSIEMSRCLEERGFHARGVWRRQIKLPGGKQRKCVFNLRIRADVQQLLGLQFSGRDA